MNDRKSLWMNEDSNLTPTFPLFSEAQNLPVLLPEIITN